MRSRVHRQHGFMLMVVVAALLMMMLGLVVSMTGELVAKVGARVSATEGTLTLIQKAIVSFSSTYQRLPCPAKPSGATNPGMPDDTAVLAPNSTCTFPGGVVPWKALGLTQEQVTDEWGRVISYRVYDGSVGLTQDMGASAVNCDTANLTAPEVPPNSLTGLCEPASGATHDTLRSSFLTYPPPPATPTFNKGLSVHDSGPDPNAANVLNVAFVLISHGPSGHGGYSPAGNRHSGPAAGARDYANTQDTPAFFIRQAASAADVPPGTTDHYDDIVAYLKISDLLTLSNQDARDWPENEVTPSFNSVSSAGMTAASNDAAAPHFMSTGGAIAGQSFTADVTGTMVQAGVGAGSFSACLWWPVKLTLVSGTSRKALTSYVEFAATDSSNDSFPGMVLGFLAGTSSVSTTGTGTTGSSTIVVTSNSGITTGMTVLGTGIATGATVSGVSGTTINLSLANTAIVSGTVTFGAPTNATCGTNIDATVTATGAAGQRNLVVSSTTGIGLGMNVFGNGIPFNATVSSITGSGAGATVRISTNTTGAVSGSVDFATSRLIRRDMGWAGGTLASYLDRFAVEFDGTQDNATGGPPAVATASDPSRPHLAFDRGGVIHGTDATSCAATATGLECDSEVTNFPSVTRTATGSVGLSVITITDAAGMYGITHGMPVAGSGIPSSTIVTAISGSVVTLSKSLTGSVSTAVFSSLPTTNFMQNGLSVFHGARVEVYPKDCYTPTATGTVGTSTVTVTDAGQLQSGMAAYGSGIGVGAAVSGPFQVNLSAANAMGFSEVVTFTGGGSTISVNATGLTGQTSISVANVAGISAGMAVAGNGIGAGATVTNVLVNLSAANSGTVGSSIIFAGATAVSTTGTGTSGSTSVTVGSASGIAPGMTALGTGFGAGTKVVTVTGTTVTLSVANASTVSGTVKFVPEKTLVKAWTLSNAGCNFDSGLCSAVKAIDSKLTYAGSSGVTTGVTGSSGSTTVTVTSASGIAKGMGAIGTGIASGAYVTSVSGLAITLSATNTGAVSGIAVFDNREMLHTASCVPSASVANAYDSIYFGLTTSSRTTGAAATTTGTGLNGGNQITVFSTTGIAAGMAVRGTGIANNATVTSVDSSTLLTLSVANSASVSGTLTFAGAANVVFRALNVGKTDLP
jgi:hypothetical protein